MNTRDSFVFYRSFYDSISHCPDEAQIVLLRAVISYGLNQEVPDFSGVPYQQFIEAIFAGIRPQLDANFQRYINGCRGGAPKGNQNARKQPKTTGKQPNDNDNDNDNDNVNVSLRNQRKHNGDNLLNLPFDDQEFIDTWNELRTQPKWRNKTTTALQKSLNKLAKYDVRFVVELMNTAIEHDYQGIVYDDTPAKYEQWKQAKFATPHREKVITRIEELYKD